MKQQQNKTMKTKQTIQKQQPVNTGLGAESDQQNAPTQSLNSQPSTLNPPARTAVFFDGPEPDQDREGEEIPVWHVYIGTEDAQPVGRVYRIFSFARAQALAQAMSHDRRLELVSDATTA